MFIFATVKKRYTIPYISRLCYYVYTYVGTQTSIDVVEVLVNKIACLSDLFTGYVISLRKPTKLVVSIAVATHVCMFVRTYAEDLLYKPS